MNAPRASQSTISAVELIELAAAQVLREDAAIDALPTILGLLATAFGGHAALAFQEDARQRMVVLAAHPGDAGADQALHAEVRALSAQQREVAATGGSVVARLASGRPPGGRPDSVLLAYSAPDSGRCLCAVALVGDSARWTADAQAAARALAAIVAGQIRHANSRTAERAARRDLASQTERLNSLIAKLQELDEAKTQFLATMSHEVRTPLTSIVSFTELILDDEAQALTPDTASSLSVIQRNAQRMLALVGDLLLLSRLESGVIPLDLAAVSLPDLIGEVARSASAGAAERGITLQVSAMAGPPIQAEQLRIEEVFDNLLANAIKFSGPGSQVRVTATHDEKMWQVVVADDGIGIPADELGSLFGRFFRASNARVAGLPGTGLGLSVVKAITELHGGSVAVQSTAEVGTTFTVCLPVGDERQGR